MAAKRAKSHEIEINNESDVGNKNKISKTVEILGLPGAPCMDFTAF